MIFCIAVFRSRTNTMEFIDQMTRAGIICRPVNTPTAMKVGCGVSARFSCVYKGVAEKIIKNYSLGTFVGFYRV
ncbi:MAG: DUF3343 domain-containing protein [Clostridia bacterium]|nr:DUF3343 domain-containing protein [Clostridia bacterium]